MLRSLLILACAVGAVQSTYDSFVAWQRGEALASVARGDPIPVQPSWMPWDPQLTLIQASAELQANPSAHPPLAEVAAQGALAATPLDPAALFVIATLKAQHHPAAGQAILRLAEKLSRREVGAELELEREAAGSGNSAEALLHMDRILSTSPVLAAPLLPAVAPSLDDPSLRTQFKGYAARRWFPSLISAGIETGVSVPALAELLNAARGRQDGAMIDSLSGSLFQRAANHNDLSGLTALMHSLPVQLQQAAKEFNFSSISTDQRLQVFRWQLTVNEVANAQLAGRNRLMISIASGDTCNFASSRQLHNQPQSEPLLGLR